MALFGTIGPALSGLSGFLGTLGGGLGTIGQFGSSVINPLIASAPVSSGPTVLAMPQSIQTMAARPMMGTPPAASNIPMAAAGLVRSLGKGISRVAAGGLIKIAESLGRRTMSVRSAIRIIRKMGKFMQPAAIAIALGITAEELGEIILADAQRTRRRMNPANVHALRRSMRRITSFHRLCQKADTLRSRGRGRSRKSTSCSPGIVQVR